MWWCEMQYPVRDDAFRNRLSTYGPNFPHCGVPADKLAEAGFRVSWTHRKKYYVWLTFSTMGFRIKFIVITAKGVSKAGKKAIAH